MQHLLTARLSRLFTSEREFEARAERHEARAMGADSLIGATTDRRRARVAGVVRAMTLRPRQRVPAFEVELFDGSGALAVVWLGRREVPGVVPGRRLVAEGMVRILPGGDRVMYNPRYQLIAAPR